MFLLKRSVSQFHSSLNHPECVVILMRFYRPLLLSLEKMNQLKKLFCTTLKQLNELIT